MGKYLGLKGKFSVNEVDQNMQFLQLLVIKTPKHLSILLIHTLIDMI